MLFLEIYNFFYYNVFHPSEFADEWYDLPFFQVGYSDFGETPQYLGLCDYLSLIATIITMVAILLFCVFIIKKIIGVMFRLFTFGA